MEVVVAVDAGTTGVRSLAFDGSGRVVATSHRELTQHFPLPGLVEHDATEIWALVETTLVEVEKELSGAGHRTVAIGVTNQRETAVAWDAATGRPVRPAIVWQDRRTAARCKELADAGHLPEVRSRTGLVLDPYFSATKWAWMIEDGLAVTASLRMGTVDDWVIWNLTGGPSGGRHVTDPTNASRTLLFDITRLTWSHELCELFGVPLDCLGEVVPSSGRIGRVARGVAGGGMDAVPVSGVAGDQQAALFGQCCFDPGDVKVTYGTGSFVLMNAGAVPPPPAEGLLTTVAWDLGRSPSGGSPIAYALEGAVFSSGATIQWLRDGLGIIGSATEVGPLAESVAATDGVFLVPAFTGLGSPWWDPLARGAIVGLTRGAGKAQIARAAVEAISFQCRDVVEAMQLASGHPVSLLKADGGAAVMDLLLAMQADQCGVRVARAATTEVTALGAAMLAGLAEGVFDSLGALRASLGAPRWFDPTASRSTSDALYAGWRRAVGAARGWEPAPA